MRVVTRNNLAAACFGFASRKIPALYVGEKGNEIYWDVPEDYRTAIREWFAHDDFVLFFSDVTS